MYYTHNHRPVEDILIDQPVEGINNKQVKK